MMVNVVAYHNPNLVPAWISYIVLPNGEYWGVRFEGSTEGIAKDKAIRLWESERAKYAKLDSSPEIAKPLQLGRGHHFAGKVWVINRATHDLKRVGVDELANYEAAGYVRGGPRSK